MVIDFSASWCVPCRTMEPVIEEFFAEYTDVEFIKLDVDELMVYICVCVCVILFELTVYIN